MRNKLLLALLATTMPVSVAFADDWNVTRLRGEVQQQVDGAWLPLSRNDIVPDDRRVRTTNNGYVTLVRGEETLELGPSTQIRIFDEGGRRPYTTVVQSWGTVAVEAEVRNVEHFAVANRYLAAVVKGTRFAVSAKSTGGSVDVERGQVGVGSSEGSTTVVSAGQAANVERDGAIRVSGQGVLPAIVDAWGRSSHRADSVVAEALADLDAARASGDVAAIAAATEALQEAADKAAPDPKGKDKVLAKTAADAATAAEKAAREAERAAEKAAREQAKTDEEARKAAEKAARDAEKNNTGANLDKSGNDNSGTGKDDHAGDDRGKNKNGDKPRNGGDPV